ncbi:hypothetical protein MNBD_NITROSPINAE03-543 [hydrothermal vent metagenome]|uniref:Restriction endonuclease type IV Mrr domain-containing protein n=1 Tax=hydrothermal vent metagenome TaxID=652676 RepID=A0A3B1BWE8_9ZZZZ
MPVLDFKEIQLPTSGAQHDQFELFARDFLDILGLKIVVGPDRGPDAGRDLIVEEIRTGALSENRVQWLVSCKHKANSGKSVTPSDEPDIHDRVMTHNCKGFIGFYSTLPSSGLATKLNASELPFEVQIFDSEKIEKTLLSSPEGALLAKRFFPLSWSCWEKEHPAPADIFRDDPKLYCHYCNKSLLTPKPHGIIVTWTSILDNRSTGKEHTEHLYWCCKGKCDEMLSSRYCRDGLVDSWEDIDDLIISVVYIRWIMATLNKRQGGATYSGEAFDKSKELLLNLFPLVSRDMTDAERDRFKHLAMIPSYLGGFGYDG